MKTIQIQKSTDIKGSIYVIVNGEKHFMRRQIFCIEVADNNPFEVIVKSSWNSSPMYTFEPKDDMVLHISRNWQLTQWIMFFLIVSLGMVSLLFFDNWLMSIFFPVCVVLIPMIAFLIGRKNSFAIKITSTETKTDNNE